MTSVLRPCLLTDNIAKTDDFYALEMLATVADKVYETERLLVEKKARSTPIDINALLPCLRQKRKLEDTELPRNSKKTRLIVHLRHPGLPLEYKDRITKLGGTGPRLLIYKKLLKSDVDTKKRRLRLIMPYDKCLVDFGVIRETQVKVIQPSNNLSDMSLTFARRDKESSYVFSGSWNDVVDVNHLQMGDSIQVWTFNNGDQLSFALVKL